MLATFALRRAVVELLTNATIAGNYVFDTRLDELDAGDLDGTRPVVSVYVEETEEEQRGNTEPFPSRVTVTLVVETAIVTRGTLTLTHPDGSTETVGVTSPVDCDANAEMLLEILGYQIRRRLACNDFDAATETFSAIRVQILSLRSYPSRDPERAARIAQRSIHVKMTIKHDCDPTGTGALPEPLNTVAPRLTLASSTNLVTGIAARLAQPVPAPAFQGANLTANVDETDPVIGSSP